MSNDMQCMIQEQPNHYLHFTYSNSVGYNHESYKGSIKAFDSLVEAIIWHNDNCESEYGLTIDVSPPKDTDMTQETMFEVLLPTKFTRRPFTVEAMQVTLNSMSPIAKWCQGRVAHTKDGVPFVEVPTGRLAKANHNRAFEGYWVVTGKDGTFSSYSDRAFQKTFEKG